MRNFGLMRLLGAGVTLSLLFAWQNGVFAQSVGISNSAITPNAASVLEVRSTTKGVLLPRMTTAERGTYTTNSALGPSHKGMTIFNTTTNRYDYWDGTQWLQMTAGVVGGALDYIQNQTGADQTAGFRINGNGLFNGGQVTIGTATPGAAGYRLTIAGAGQTFLATDNDMNWQARNSGGTYEFFLTPRGADNVTYLNYGSVGMNIRNNASANTLFLRPNNNVGVGTTSPEEALELYRSGSDPVLSFHRAGVGSYKMGTDGSVFKLAAMDNGFGGHTGNFQNNDTQVLSMINNGNVGIGNVAPSQKVQIDVSNNGLNIPLFIRNTNNTNGSNYVGIGLTNESGNNAVKSAITFERTANFGVGKLHFMLNNDAASASSVAAADIKMTIQPNGNVGIGTTSPSQHLTVQQTGTARVSVRGASTFGVLGNDPTDGPYISWVNTQPLRFSTATDDQGAGWTERMRISNAGVVRIANLSGGGDRYVRVDNNGDLYSATGLSAGSITADNGLNINTGNNVRLGGTLAVATSIAQAGFSLGISGGTINLNDNSPNAVNIATGSSTGTVSIGTGATAQVISIGAGASNKTVTLGSSSFASMTTINSGSAGVLINNSNAQPTFINAAGGDVSLANGASGGNVYLGRNNLIHAHPTSGVGIGGSPSGTYKFEVFGKVKSTGINETSDERLKKNFEPIDGALGMVRSMSGKYYDWRTDEFPDKNLEKGRQVGVIAQEIEAILPEVVTTDNEGFKAVEYGHLVPVLIEAIKELSTQVQGQNLQINVLKAEIEDLKGSRTLNGSIGNK